MGRGAQERRNEGGRREKREREYQDEVVRLVHTGMGTDADGRHKRTAPWVAHAPTVLDAPPSGIGTEVYDDPRVARVEALPLAALMALHITGTAVRPSLLKRFRDYAIGDTLEKRRKLTVMPWPAESAAPEARAAGSGDPHGSEAARQAALFPRQQMSAAAARRARRARKGQ